MLIEDWGVGGDCGNGKAAWDLSCGLYTHLAANLCYLYLQGRSEKAEMWLGSHQTQTSVTSELIMSLWEKLEHLQERRKVMK